MWILKHFNELENAELYEILQLRSKVFVLEQNCAYVDEDGKDLTAFHLFKKADDKIVAYCRLLAPGDSFAEASIGRVITHPHYRRSGFGKDMMPVALKETRKMFNTSSIRIGAQCYLIKFYESFGFVVDSGVYLEDNIEHVEMLLK